MNYKNFKAYAIKTFLIFNIVLNQIFPLIKLFKILPKEKIMVCLLKRLFFL